MAKKTFLADDDMALLMSTLPKRELLSGVSIGVSSFQFTFPLPYKEAPLVEAKPTWIGAQRIEAAISNVTKTDCTLTIMRSKGTLVLSTGAFEVAPNGTAFQIIVTGVHA